MVAFVRELSSFIVTRKKYMLVPILVTMVVLGGLIVLTKGTAVAPFIYTIF